MLRHLGRQDVYALEQVCDPNAHAAEPGSPVAMTEEQDSLLAAMATLPEETRSIMIMHYYQGLKLTEIAEMLELNVNSLKVRIHRARRTLRLALTDRADGFAARQETG